MRSVLGVSALVLIVLLLLPEHARAQIVRGTVTERGSGVPLAGVLMSLETEGGAGQTDFNVLTDEQGAFALRGIVGTYRLSAKRIGVERYVSEPFDLTAGETRVMDVQMAALVYQLPAVRIVDASVCVLRDEDRSRVNSLWDEARTALTAANLSQRDRLFQGSITRYKRRLDPRTLKVLEDSWSELVGTYDRTFTSPSGDSLSRIGYWRVTGTDAVYYAPDGDVLLSRAFRRDHCFSIVENAEARSGMIGLGFTPVATRRIPDVQGVLWMDARTFALELVEFGYTQLPEAENSGHVGGELRFARLANGAWVTSRWSLRMPEYIASTDTRSPVLMTRPVVRALIEEGGMAFGPGLRLYTTPAGVTGTLADSAGQPASGVSVRLAGTPYATRTTSTGAFRLDSLPAGHFTLLAEEPGYAAFGTAAAELGVDLLEGVTTEVTLRAQNGEQLANQFCPGVRLGRNRGIVRAVVVDRDTGRPLSGMAAWLRWGRNLAAGGDARSGGRDGEERRTDATGAVTWCNVPANTPMAMSGVNALGRPARDSVMITVRSGAVVPVRLATRRP